MVTKNRSRKNNPVNKSNAPPVKMPESINNIPVTKETAPTKAVTGVPAAGTLEAAPAIAAKAPELEAAPAAAGTLEAAPAPAKAPELEVTPAAPDTKTTDPAAAGEPVSAPKPDALRVEPVTPVPASTTDALRVDPAAPVAPIAQEPADADELAEQPPDGEHDEPANPDSDGQPPTDTTTTDTTTTTDPNCTIYASPFSSANPNCYVEKKNPQLFQIAKAALHAPVDAILDGGAQLLVDTLKATGNDKLVEAALAESLTSDQAKLLSTVMTDPKVEEEVDALKSKLSNVITTGIDEVEKTVLPPLQTAIGEAVGGTVESVLAEVDDIPPFGAVRGAIGLATTIANGVAAGEKAIDGLQDAAAPVKKVMGEVGDLTAAMNEAAAKAEGAASNAEGAASNAASNAVAGAEDATSSAASNAEDAASNAEDAASNAEDAASSAASGAASNAVAESEAALPAPQFTKGDTPDNTNKSPLTKQEKISENIGGGSRKRRHIHKLSRRIERTLRRVQKKYGLKDKNDFLRRTLHSRKK